VAYAVEFDDATEETEEPRILFRAGHLPRELAGED
jgi:hypothetical protein